jgi:hypothetical protein
MHASIKKKKKRSPNIFENDNSTTHTVKVNAKTSHTRTTIVKKDTTSLVVGRTPSSSRSALIPVPPSSIVGVLGHLQFYILCRLCFGTKPARWLKFSTWQWRWRYVLIPVTATTGKRIGVGQKHDGGSWWSPRQSFFVMIKFLYRRATELSVTA